MISGRLPLPLLLLLFCGLVFGQDYVVEIDGSSDNQNIFLTEANAKTNGVVENTNGVLSLESNPNVSHGGQQREGEGEGEGEEREKKKNR